MISLNVKLGIFQWIQAMKHRISLKCADYHGQRPNMNYVIFLWTFKFPMNWMAFISSQMTKIISVWHTFSYQHERIMIAFKPSIARSWAIGILKVRTFRHFYGCIQNRKIARIFQKFTNIVSLLYHQKYWDETKRLFRTAIINRFLCVAFFSPIHDVLCKQMFAFSSISFFIPSLSWFLRTHSHTLPWNSILLLISYIPRGTIYLFCQVMLIFWSSNLILLVLGLFWLQRST